MIHTLQKTLSSKRFMRYVVVGLAAFAMEYGSFFTLFVLLHVWLSLANGISFCIGSGSGFLLNRLWAFKHQDKSYTKKTTHQMVFYFGLALINLALTILLVDYFKHIGIDPRIGKLLAMALTSVWNFVLYHLYIFNQSAV